MDINKILLALCLKFNNDWNSVYSSLVNRYELSDEDIQRAEIFSGNFISLLDANYPERLKRRYKAPFILYYDGDISLLHLTDEDDFIFLHGENIFNIPEDKLITISPDNKVNICGRLNVWFNDEPTNVDCFGLATCLAHKVVGTKIYPEDSRSWFLSISVPTALSLGIDIYMVPSISPSFNNRLIKEGCFLIDSYNDLLRR